MFKKKILFITSSVDSDRRADFLLDLIVSLNKEVFMPVFVDIAGGKYNRNAGDAGIETIDLDVPTELLELKEADIFNPLKFTGLMKGYSALKDLKKYIREEKITHIYSNGSLSHMLAALAARSCGIVSVWHTREYFRPPVQYFVKIASVLPTRIISNSKFVAEQYLNSNKITIVSDGVQIEKVAATGRWEEVREKMGIPLDARIIGTMASGEAAVRTLSFIEVAEKICRRKKNVFFVISGDFNSAVCDEKQKLIRIVNEMGIAHRVMIEEVNGNRYDLMNEFDIFIGADFDYRYEVFDVLDAMSMGKSVIVGSEGAFKEIINNGENGIFAQLEDTDYIEEIIVNLLDNPEVMKALGDNARNLIRRSYDLKDQNSRIETILKGL